MDFTRQFHPSDPFSAASQGQQQYGQFVTIPPLTPTDDYRNTSPPDPIDGLPYNQFQNLNYGTHQSSFPNQTNFSGPPTPPTNGVSLQHHLHQQDHGYDGSNEGAVAAARLADNGGDVGLNSGRGDAGSEDDDDKTPAQLRRKAQNRAAQRAFRERKEKHVKDLETKIASLEDAAKDSTAEIERLKRDLQQASTENEILRATSRATADPRNLSPARPAAHQESTTFSGPKTYSPTDFYTTVLEPHENKQPSHRILTAPGGERLYGVAAAWELIAQHEAFKRGTLDMGRVSDELKSSAKCDGQGPVFAESDIIRAVMVSVEHSTDDLL